MVRHGCAGTGRLASRRKASAVQDSLHCWLLVVVFVGFVMRCEVLCDVMGKKKREKDVSEEVDLFKAARESLLEGGRSSTRSCTSSFRQGLKQTATSTAATPERAA